MRRLYAHLAQKYVCNSRLLFELECSHYETLSVAFVRANVGYPEKYKSFGNLYRSCLGPLFNCSARHCITLRDTKNHQLRLAWSHLAAAMDGFL